MNWYKGTIAEAIRTAKTQQAIFVVYVEGEDENSQLMSEILNASEICDGLSSNKFVAIKLPSNDVGYRQFVEIYKLVPVPSLFFIGNSGAPLDIVAADSSRSNLETKIKEAIAKCNSTSANKNLQSSSVTVDSSGPSTSKISDQPVTNDKINKPESITSVQREADKNPSLEDRVEKAKKLLEKKKQEKEIKEIEEEKEKEFERRKIGQEMQKNRKKQKDLELKEMIEEREREKRESAAAKQRILEQIAQDRAERAEREQRIKAGSSSSPSNQTTTHSVSADSHPVNVNITRIQFKLPTGEARTHSFPPDTTLLQVREFINNNIELSFREYRLATTFPRREFTGEDDERTLSFLNLIPTGVILILPLAVGNVRPYTRDWLKIVTNLFWDMVQPVFSLANYIQQYFSPRPASTPPSESPASPPPQQQSSSQPSRSVVRRSGNIHSLRDMRDENDENNTWNGNSTQQM